MLGTIRQPEFVICDPALLLTLPQQEYLSGVAELIKTAIIGDKELFELIERNVDKIMSRNQELLISLIAKSVKFKGLVVSKDEYETGLRRILNFGHTFGHAVEMQKSVKHGFAVAAGMKLATDFSFEKGYIGQDEKARINDMLKSFKLIDRLDIRKIRWRSLCFTIKRKPAQIYICFHTGNR